jgi:hypothetical protein
MDDQGTNRACGRITFRKLRITIYAASGIICLVLIVLWVRSYWKMDLLTLPISSTRVVEIGVVKGVIMFRAPPLSYFRSKGWLGTASELRGLSSTPAPQSNSSKRPQPSRTWIRVESTPIGSGGQVHVPYWMLVVVSAALSLPLLKSKPWRFSLRTLLIGMTVVAALLGALVWATRK